MSLRKYLFFSIAFFLFILITTAQVGINTITPHSSAVLDVTSNSQGMLTPRMTSAERTSISSPANGLIVFDTDEDNFYYFDGVNWIELLNEQSKRDNHVLVKSEADLPAPVGGIITLDTNTIYEINGSVVLNNSINLNEAYITGFDANEDVLIRVGGTLFTGSKGGSLRTLTLTAPGGTVFDLDDTVGDQNLVAQQMIIANSGSVGTLKGFNLFFASIIQFSGNSGGIVYTDINNLLLNNLGWFGDNNGTYETLTGTFDLIEKVSGFSHVIAATAALDVTGVTTITGDAVMQNVVFYGGGNYIMGNSPYSGFNFTNDWSVSCPGIPEENDDNAAGNFYYDGNISTGFVQDIPFTQIGSNIKLTGNSNTNSTNPTSLFRFSGTNNNRLTYEGTKSRDFQVTASLSIRGDNAGEFVAFLIAKNGVVLTESNSVVRIDNASDIQNVALNTIVSLDPSDYIEIYVNRITGSGTLTLSVFSENLSIK